jgi:hypothetical protein
MSVSLTTSIRINLPITFYIVDQIIVKDLPSRAEKFKDWGRFQNLSSELVSPRIQINFGEGADYVSYDFTASRKALGPTQSNGYQGLFPWE